MKKIYGLNAGEIPADVWDELEALSRYRIDNVQLFDTDGQPTIDLWVDDWWTKEIVDFDSLSDVAQDWAKHVLAQ